MSLLSPDQVHFYEEEGYLVLPNLLTAEELAPAREAMEEKVEEIAQELKAAGQIDATHADAPVRDPPGPALRGQKRHGVPATTAAPGASAGPATST